jgi:hypothetical protein
MNKDISKNREAECINSKNTPIFIVGSARSGTTMIGELLTKANVGKSFEGHFVVDAFQHFGSGKLSKVQMQKLLRKINSYESIKCFDIGLVEKSYFGVEKVTTKKIVIDVLEKIASNHPSKQWIEKTPHYIYNVKLLLKTFPEAKILWVLRDGRDVAHSVFQKNWGANNVYYAAKEWLAANYQNAALNDKRVLLVKYEDVLSSPKEGLSKIFKFLHFNCTNIETLSSAIDPQKMNRWKQTLSRRQINTYEAIAFECLKKYGYETNAYSQNKISWVWKIIYTTHNYFKLGLHLANENTVKAIKIKLGIKKPFDEKN